MKSYLPLLCVGALAFSMLVGVDGIIFDQGPVLAFIGTLRNRIDEVESRLERRGCVTGRVFAEICDTDDSECVLSFALGEGLREVNTSVSFNPIFESLPMVHTSLGGTFSSINKNCSVTATDITETGFNLRIIVGGFLPFTIDASWIACDARLPIIKP